MDSLDSLLIAPLRPYLSLITRNLPAPLDNLAASLLGPACHASLVQSLDFTTANRACVSLAISKALGIAIVAASAIVKVPQLLKLLNSRSAAGLSFLAVLLETISLVISLAYNARSGFPFSTYGESAFIAIQNVALAALILNFSGRRSMLIFFLTNLAAGLYALFAKNYVSMSVLSYLQASAGLLAVASKVPQIWTVHQEGSTGQLSAFAVRLPHPFLHQRHDCTKLIVRNGLGFQLPRR